MSFTTFLLVVLLIFWWHLAPWLIRLGVLAVIKKVADQYLTEVKRTLGRQTENVGPRGKG